jgi:hypothetical protein
MTCTIKVHRDANLNAMYDAYLWRAKVLDCQFKIHGVGLTAEEAYRECVQKAMKFGSLPSDPAAYQMTVV